MTQNLANFLTGATAKAFAIRTGTAAHAALQRVVLDSRQTCGDQELIDIIKNRSDLAKFFVASAKTEVSIAGVIHGHFISRRIDRMLINHDTKTIDFVDYKTDTDKTVFIKKYREQLSEYAELLSSAYPGFKINGYILWLHDWNLELSVKM